jgi:TolB protein
MNPDGTGLTKMIRQGDSPSWNPRGTLFAYTGLSKGKNKTPEIFVAQADGSSPRQLTSDPAIEAAPAWSPDVLLRQQIAFVRNGQIWLMDTDGENERPLVTTGSNAAPTWSPRGDEIAFTCVRAVGTSDICTVDVATGAVTNLTPGGRNETGPDWSPDGQTIVFSSSSAGEGGDEGLYTIEPHALIPTPRLLFDRPATDETDPAWSPNGVWIAYAGQPLPLTQPDIYVMPADGHFPTFQATIDPAWDGRPDWAAAT